MSASKDWNIRKYDPQDVDQVLVLCERFASWDATPKKMDVEGWFSRNPAGFYVAEDSSGRVVGFIFGYERKNIPEEVLGKWKAKRVGYIDIMVVDEKHRRKGIGSALLNILLGRFEKSGIDLVHLDVPAEEEAARRLYENAGFSIRAHSMRKRL